MTKGAKKEAKKESKNATLKRVFRRRDDEGNIAKGEDAIPVAMRCAKDVNDSQWEHLNDGAGDPDVRAELHERFRGVSKEQFELVVAMGQEISELLGQDDFALKFFMDLVNETLTAMLKKMHEKMPHEPTVAGNKRKRGALQETALYHRVCHFHIPCRVAEVLEALACLCGMSETQKSVWQAGLTEAKLFVGTENNTNVFHSATQHVINFTQQKLEVQQARADARQQLTSSRPTHQQPQLSVQNSKKGRKGSLFELADAFNPLDWAVPEGKVKAAVERYGLIYDDTKLFVNRHELVRCHAFPTGADGAKDAEPFVRAVYHMLVNDDHPVTLAFKYNTDPKSGYSLPADVSIKYSVAGAVRAVPGGKMKETVVGLL